MTEQRRTTRRRFSPFRSLAVGLLAVAGAATLGTLAMLLAGPASPASAAGTTVSCAFNSGTGAVTVTSNGATTNSAPIHLFVGAGNDIEVDSTISQASGSWCIDGGTSITATTALTTTITVGTSSSRSQVLLLDLTTGSLGPAGLPCSITVSADLQGSGTAIIEGAPGVGVTLGASGISLASTGLGACTTGPDLTLANTTTYQVNAGSGAVVLSTIGDGATGAPFASGVTLNGFSGGINDRFVVGQVTDTVNGNGALAAVLDLSNEPTGITVNTALGKVSGAVQQNFSNVQDFVGSAAGSTTFLTSAASNFIFSGGGAASSNTLDLSTAPANGGNVITVNVAAGSAVVPANSVTDTFSGIATFAGSSSGFTDFVVPAPGGSFTFTGGGSASTNTIDLSAVAAGTIVDVTPATPTATLPGGAGTETFGDIGIILGPSAGGTTFRAGATGGFQFNAAGTGNSLDLSTAGTAVDINASLPGGSVTGLSPGPDGFANIGTFTGPSTGSATFQAPATGGYTFIGKGSASSNTLTMTSAGTGIVIDVTGTVACVAGSADCVTGLGAGLGGKTIDQFSGITQLTGSGSGSTTFVSGSSGGFSFTGQSVLNTVNLSQLNSNVTVDLTSNNGSVSGITSGGNDAVIGIRTVLGPTAGSTTFKLGNTGGYTITAAGTASSNVLDLTATTLTIGIDVTGTHACIVGNADCVTGLNGSGDDQFSGINQILGSNSGSTVFTAGPSGGFTFTGAGSGNTLNLGPANAGLVVTVTGTPGTVTGLTSGSDSFTGVQAVTGSTLGNTTFVAGPTGGYTFLGGPGTRNTLNLSGANSGITIDIAGGSVTGLTTGGSDTFNGATFPTIFGSTLGSTTFKVPGSGGYVLTGQGAASTNVLDLSAGGTGITVDVTGTALCPASASDCASGLTAGIGGLHDDQFAGVDQFVGSSSGQTTFVGGSSGGFSFTGKGSSNVLNLTQANAGIVIDATTAAGSVSALASGGNDTFTRVTILDGSSAGSTTFKGGSTGGYTFTAAGAGNVLDLSAANANIDVDTGGTVSNLTTNGNDTFSFITTVKGSLNGSTTFSAGASGGFTFIGQGTASTNVLDLSGANQGITVTVTSATGTVAGLSFTGNDAFTGIGTVDGSASGHTSFVAGQTGGYTFNGGGTGNILDLSTANAGITVNVVSGTVSGLTTGGNDSFTTVTTLKGSGSGSTTFFAGNGGNFTFQGQGTASTNILNLSSVTIQVSVYVFNVGCLVGASQCVIGLGSPDQLSGIASFVGSASGGTTFMASSSGGFSFTGQGSNNQLNLSNASSGVTVNLTGASPSVSGLAGGNDTFTDIQILVGSGAGGNTFIAPSSGGFTFTATGSSNNILNLSAAASGITVDVTGSGACLVNPYTACVAGLSGGNDELSGITSVIGSSSGGTVFKAGNSGGFTFTGQGLSNTLDFSGITGLTGVTVNLVTGQATPPGGGSVTFSDIQIFNGSSNSDTFVVGPGNYTFNGGGATSGPGDTLDFSSVSVGVTVNLTTNPNQVTLGAQGTDTFTGVTIFKGSTQGGNTFLAGSTGGYSFVGQGTASTNTLNLSAANGGIAVDVTTSSGAVTGLTGGGGTTDSFTGSTVVVGSSAGSTDFKAGSTGGYSFTGQGGGNTLDLTAASSGVTFNLLSGTPTVTGLAGGNDTFLDMQTLDGSNAGGNSFVVPSSGGFTFSALGSNNTLNLSGTAAGITVDVSGATGTVSGLTSGGNDLFTGIKSIVGSSSGGTTFTAAGVTAGYTFTGGGSANSNLLDLSAAGSGVVVDVTDTVLCLNGTTSNCVTFPSAGDDSFSGISRIKTPTAGSATVRAGPAGGFAFTGQGTASTNTLDLSSANGGTVVDLTVATPSVGGLSSGGNDSFTGLGIIDGSTSGATTFKATSTGGFTFNGKGAPSTNLLDLSAASAGISVSVLSGQVTGLVGGSDSMSGIGSFKGASAGGTTFAAGGAGGFTFTGQGTASTNALNLTAANSGILVDVSSATITVSGLSSGGNDTASGLTAITGSSAGSTSFRAGSSGGFTFTGAVGTPNTLDLSVAGSGLVVDLTLGSPRVTGLGSGSSDSFSAVTTFIGALAGSTTFRTGPTGGYTFTGQGTAASNVLNLSQANGGITVDVTGTVGCPLVSSDCVENLAVGSSTDAFSGIATIVGPTAGSTVFRSGGGGGFTFTGNGGGNTLDLSASASGVTVTMTSGTPTVSGLSGGSDTFSGITTVVGSNGGGNTFLAGPIGGFTFSAAGNTNALNLAAAGSGITIDVGGAAACLTGPSDCVLNLAGGTKDQIAGITIFTGSSSGSDTFRAGSVGGFTFTGEGLGNTLDFSSIPSGGATVAVNLITGLAQPSGSGNDSFADIQNFVGSPNNDTFTVGTGNYSFNGGGGFDTLDFSSVSTGITVNLTTSPAQVTVGAQGTDTFTNIQRFLGSTQGNNTFLSASTGGFTFVGQGTSSTNVLNLSSAAPGGPITIDTTGITCAGGATACVTGLVSGQDAFSGIGTFIGAVAGNTDFRAGSVGGLSFTGQGSGDTFDASAATSGVTVNLTGGTPTVSGLSGGNDTFTDVQKVVGSNAGHNTFAVAGAGGYTLTAAGGTNTLNLAAAGSGATVDVTGSGPCLSGGNTACVSGLAGGNDELTGITLFVGSASGGTTFRAANAGGFTFTGQGAGNTLDFSAVTGGTGVGINLVNGQVTLPVGSDTFTDVTGYVGSPFNDTFTVGTGSYTFTGGGGSDTATFASVQSGITVNVTTATASVTGASVNDSLTGIRTFVGSSGGGNVFKGGSSGGYTFTGGGFSGNVLDLSGVSGAATGAAFDLVNGTVTLPGGGGTDFFDGIQSFVGTAYADTFTMALGSFSITGNGGNDTLDFTTIGTAVTVNVATNPGTATGGGVNDSFTGITSVIGPSAGGSTFKAGSTGGFTFTGRGSGNTLDFSQVPNGAGGVLVDVVTGQATPNGGSNDTFSDMAAFTGSPNNDTFVMGAGTYAVHGGGGADTFDASAGPAGLTFTLTANPGTVVGTGWNDTLVGVQALVGASAGTSTFVASSGSGYSFTGQGTGNVLDLSAAPAGIAVDDSSVPGMVHGLAGGGTDTFTDIGTFTGSTLGGTSFTAPVLGGVTFTGQGLGNSLNLSGAPSGITVNVTGAQPTITGLPLANDNITGITGFTGSSGGGTTFIAGSAAGYSFIGLGSGNTLSLAAVTAGGPGATIDAHGGQVTLPGGSDVTSGIQNFIGTPNNDLFVAGTGNLTFTGGGGIDTISFQYAPTGVNVNLSNGQIGGGFGGVDTVSGIQNVIGSPFNDIIEGNLQPSIFSGGGGNNTFVLVGGNDLVNGGTGTDTVDLSQTQSTVSIDLNDPYFQDTGGAGSVLLVPGTIQNVVASPFGTRVLGGLATGTLNGGSGTDYLDAGAGNYTLNAGSGTDTLVAGSGNDVLNGGSGTDVFVPGSGTVAINGGTGNGTLDFSGAPTGVNVNLSGTPFVLNLPGTFYISNSVLPGHSASGGWGGRVTINGVENVIGTSFNDVIVGDSNTNRIQEGAGNDLVVGNGGGDTLIGGGGNDIFMTGAGNNSVDCGGGNCTIDYSNAPTGVNVNLTNGTANNGFGGTDTLTGIKNAIGSQFADVIVGGAPGGLIQGLGGNDTLQGGYGGFDTLKGGAGNVTFIASAAGHDTILGGSGNNTIFAQNGQPDYINGGVGGFNQASVDPFDTVINVQQLFT